MAKVLIIGAGLGGLAAALFIARRGHEVIVFEQDQAPPPLTPDACFFDWTRRSIGHARQTHVFMPLSNQILRQEAPDVFAELVASGAAVQPAPFTSDADAPPIMGARRLVYESVLRRAAAKAPGVTICSGVKVRQLQAKLGNPPIVTGVITETGRETSADLVIDAAGRGSQMNRWLEMIGARSCREATQKTGFSYLTRWYKLSNGAEFPELRGPPGAQCNFATFLIGQADNRCFSLMIGLSESDPLRHAPRAEAVFDRIVAVVPHTREWARRGEPLLPPQPYGNVGNYRRWLTDEHGPVIGGIVSMGDSSVRTNSTLGRGVSLAYLHARHIAETIDRALIDPISYVAAFEQWTQEHLGTWFDTQVAIDGHYAAKLEAFHSGEIVPDAPLTARIFCALSICALHDPEVAELFGRMIGLLITLEEVLAVQGVKERIAPYLGNNGQFFPSVEFERSEFERLVVNA